MKKIIIPIEVTSDVLLALNETEQEVKEHFQVAVAIMLFHEEKLSLGKAIQLSGLSRYEFEKALAKNNIPVSKFDLNEVVDDVDKLDDL